MLYNTEQVILLPKRVVVKLVALCDLRRVSEIVSKPVHFRLIPISLILEIVEITNLNLTFDCLK